MKEKIPMSQKNHKVLNGKLLRTKRVKQSLNVKSENKTETVCLMNMCMIQDGHGNVLALDKVNDSYTGTTFPGGHVEQEENFHDSVVREVHEETGLDIENPRLCGVYHWMKAGIHHVIFLYKADKYAGELKSSEEGQVYWIPMDEFKEKELAAGMEYALKIIESDQYCECYMQQEADGYVGTLY
jgi:8-oxo-dGTP diphosphatase